MTSPTRAQRIMLDNLQAAVRDHSAVLRGHDAVHPDRDVCGGVGGCRLMLAEHETARDAVDLLERLARSGWEPQINGSAAGA